MAEVTKVTNQLLTAEKTGSLDDLFLDVVDKTLKELFKETGTTVVYNFLEKNSHLKQEEIAEKPEVFSEGLRQLLGTGALVVEVLILRNLYSNLGLKFEDKRGYEFPDYVKELRKDAAVKA